MDISAFKKHNRETAFKSLGSFKKHLKTVHFCEFSPSGRQLFTGSVDGTAKIWKIESGSSKLTDDKIIAVLE
jgi:WD40 repeat protein